MPCRRRRRQIPRTSDSEQCEGTTRCPATSPPATPLDDDDLLAEFLLHLPPRPSSLPRAAAVCKAWRRIVTDPHFLRRFRAHHRKPPLLGFFNKYGRFFPTLEAPDRVAAARLSVSTVGWKGWKVAACRDGLVLCRQGLKLQVLDPMTGDCSAVLTREDKLPKPLNVELVVDSTGVKRPCFRLFALSTDADWTMLSASVYSSDSGAWVHTVETLVTQYTYRFKDCPSTLVGNTFYWTDTYRILRYDLEIQALNTIEIPYNEEVEQDFRYNYKFTTRTKDGILGFKTSNEDEPTIHIAVKETVLASAEKWMSRKTVLLDSLLPIELKSYWLALDILWYDKENSVILLWTPIGTFMISLESIMFTKVSEEKDFQYLYPYSSFVTTDAR